MKILRVVVTALSACLAANAFAFHTGGVAECEGCHTMHNSFENQAIVTNTSTGLAQFAAGPYLLKGSDQSSACLNCHQQAGLTAPDGYHISTPLSEMPSGVPPTQLTPGGDFGWLKKSYTWVDDFGNARTSRGERHGHNIVAADYGYVVDSTIHMSPGGDYPAANLHCSSCHDPHGRYRVISYTPTSISFATTGLPIKDSGSYGAVPDAIGAIGTYRLLAGVGYLPRSVPAGTTTPFTFAPFVAVSPTTYNRSEATSDTRVAYGRDPSAWCANCHLNIHSEQGIGTIAHPTGVQLGTEISSNYNRYVKSGDLTGLARTNTYTSLLPVQKDNSVDIGGVLYNMANGTSFAALTTDRVICFSCHRAHASAFDSMTRFGLANEFITVATATGTPLWPDLATDPFQAQGRTTAETQRAYYDRPATQFAPFQRVLCNKCHAKD